MNKIHDILEDIYQLAASNQNLDSGLTEEQNQWINTIIEKAESQKAVLTVLITSCVKKIETPTQDVRYHKIELPDGYSGRGLDTSFVTPFMKERFLRFSMYESGWTTRSLEQPHAFTLDFPGKIRNVSVKIAFLNILNDLEEKQADPKRYLYAIFIGLIELMNRPKITRGLFESENSEIGHTQQSDTVTIENIVNLLKRHFSIGYGVAGASRLPVLAVYSAYELLIEIDRYKGKTLSQLKSHTSSDIRSGGIGDIEVLNEDGEFFEAVEIKHNIPISSGIVESSFQKFLHTHVSRYYLLTTAEPNVEGVEKVEELVSDIHKQHGCEVIINGILPSIKYYLRMLSNPKLFIDAYTKNLEFDYDQNTDIKEIHLRYWNDLLKNL